MLIVDITYTQPIETIEAYLADHRAWLQVHYDQGLLLASGPKNPRLGGVIIALADKAQMEVLIQDDPFFKNNLAWYSFTEFEPVKMAQEINRLVKGQVME